MKKFIDSFIKSLKPNDKRYFIREDAPHGEGGFGIRVNPTGKKSWHMIYTFEGSRKWLCLGNYPDTSLSKAREKFRDMKETLAEGKNPGEETRAKKKERRDSWTINLLCDEFLEKYCQVNKRPRSAKEDKLNLARDVRKAWGKKKARDIRRSDVISLLDEILGRGTGVQANRTLATVRKMFAWALEREVVELNPASGISKPFKETPKDRHLSDDEIKTLWDALNSHKDVPLPVLNTLKIMLLTGNRGGELLKAKSTQLDDNWLEIPREDAKNNQPYRIYLSDFAKKIIETNGSEYLIDRKGISTLEVYTLSAWVRRKNYFGLPPWSPHDLRRTCTTKLAEMGVQPHIIDRATNHKIQGVIAKVYDQYLYSVEIKKALTEWSNKLCRIISSDQASAKKKVIPIR